MQNLLEKVKEAAREAEDFLKGTGAPGEFMAAWQKSRLATELLLHAIVEEVNAISDAMPKRVDGTPAHRPAPEGEAQQ